MSSALKEVALRCRCGRVRGVASDVSPDTGNRVVCYCDDCQAFARFLERDDVTNAAGGSDIYQLPPARLRITEGAELLRCLRLSPGGRALFRWYTECCRTPVANTLPRVAFAGTSHLFMDHAADGRSRDEVLGPPLGHIHTRYARGPVPPEAQARVSFGLIVRSVRTIGGWTLRGLGQPSPFFDAETREPRVTPRVLTPDERAALRPA
jgi:hypothetical protein